MLRSLLVTITAFFLAFGAYTDTQASADSSITASQTVASCLGKDNLTSTADAFISRCKKGSIRGEFPSEFNQVTLAVIKRNKTARGKRAWKLLNDHRFDK
jgi:hypothetical protein